MSGSVADLGFDEKNPDRQGGAVEQFVFARGENPDGVAFGQCEFLAFKGHDGLALDDIGDFLLEMLGKPGGVAFAVGFQGHHQEFDVGFEGAGGEGVVNGVFLVRVVNSLLFGAAADQRGVVDVLDEQRRQRNAEGLSDGFQYAQTGIADAALELADQGGADTGFFGKLLDRKAVFLPVFGDSSPDFHIFHGGSCVLIAIGVRDNIALNFVKYN